jgi:adhesin transport system outer membrane protein
MTQAFEVRRPCAALMLLFVWPFCFAQSLPDLIEGVLASHPSLRAQKALGESAKDAVEGAKWQFFPTPSIGFEQVDAGKSDPNYPSFGDKNVTTLRLQQPLWTGGRLTAGLDRAQAGVLSSQATLDGVRQDLALRVLQFYADWYGALLKRQAYEKSLAAHQGLQEQINRRIAGGVSPQSDLTLLLGRKQQTEADLFAAQAQEQTALGRLAQLLGHALLPNALGSAVAAPQALGPSAEVLLAQAQTLSPAVIKLQAQAQAAEAEITTAKADLMPEVYLRAESQYGSYSAPNVANQNRFFVGLSSRFGAGLSSLTQVSGAQARYQAALADIDSTRLSLGEQIQADYAQAQSGQTRLVALQASLEAADNITKAWSRQFVAGRKTWPDVMNAVRELAQLEAQIADARASQLLLSWRLAIVGRGLESALLQGQQQVAQALPERPALVTVSPTAVAQVVQAAQAIQAEIPLYAEDPADAFELRMALALDPLRLGVDVGLGLRATPGIHSGHDSELHSDNPNEASW